MASRGAGPAVRVNGAKSRKRREDLALAFRHGMLARYEREPDPPNKEKLPENRPLARHPWELTVREFVEKVRSDYGVELSITQVLLAASLYLRKGDRIYPLPLANENDVIPPDVLRTLCLAFSVPPLDFHLDPDPDED
jgi:hypothetical protein